MQNVNDITDDVLLGSTPAVQAGKGPHVSSDLVDLVIKMRNAQKAFFAKGSSAASKAEALHLARRLEREVDQFTGLYCEQRAEWDMQVMQASAVRLFSDDDQVKG